MAARGGGAKLGGALPNLCSFGPKTANFRPKWPPNAGGTPKRREMVVTSRCGLTLRCQGAVSCPSTPRYVRETAQKGAKKPQKLRNVHQHPETKNGPYLGLRGSKVNSEGTQSIRNPPLLVVSKPRTRPHGRLDPRTSGHLVELEGSPARARWGPTVGSPGSPGRKKLFFPKMLLDHFRCSNKCF